MPFEIKQSDKTASFLKWREKLSAEFLVPIEDLGFELETIRSWFDDGMRVDEVFGVILDELCSNYSKTGRWGVSQNP